MFDSIVRYSVYRPGLALMLAASLLGGAIWAFQKLPLDAVPDITNVQVQILTPAPGFDGETIEANVTYPIESAMGAIPRVQEIRSLSRYGISAVTIVFDEGADIYRARQLITEQLQTVELEGGLQPRLGPIATGLGEIFHYTVEAREPADNPEERLRQLMRLRTIQEWDIKRRLLTVQGVAEVNTIGGYPEVYFVQPDPALMARYGIHFEDIVQALRMGNRNAGGGYIQQSADQIIVQGAGLFRTLEDVRNLSVKQLPDLTALRVRDLARVAPDREIRTGAAVADGEEVILGTAFMLLGENSRTVSERVAAKMDAIRKTLPEDVVVRTMYDRSYLVEGTIETIRENLLYGAMLVIVVLFALTGAWRAALITAFVIPLSMAATLIAMYFTGVSANLMSLGALDFGIIIDGAVIVVDRCASVVRERANAAERTLTRSEIRDAVASASVEIRQAAGFGQMIILVVFLPIFTLTGIEGRMFRPMAASFCFALLAAFALAFTVVPALSGLALKGKPSRRGHFLMDLLDRLYVRTLRLALRWRALTLLAAGLALALGYGAYARLGGEFIPQLYERAVAMQFIRPPSIALDKSVQLDRISQRVILEFAEVDRVFTRIGSAEIANDPMGVNVGDCYIMLKPRDEWPVQPESGARRTPAELTEALQRAVEARVPGQRILMSQPIQLRFNELLEGARADVSLKIFGEELATLQELSDRAAEIVSDVPGAGEAEAETRGGIPILRIVPDSDMLHRLGVPRERVLEAVGAGLGGADAGHLYQGVRRFPLRVRLAGETREDLTRLGQLPVGVTESSTLPLAQLADIRIEESFEMITREALQRRSAVLINPRGRDTQSVVEEAQTRIANELDLPEGYYVEWGGNFQNLAAARARLAIVAPLAFAVVALMIYSAFRDWLRTTLVLSGVPFALVGGAISLWISSQPFSISAGVGFIALFGIAVLNGLVLVSQYGALQSGGASGAELAVQGARSRLRAVFMTALTDVFGFLPMMLATGLGAEVQRPLATVVVGGVLTSTLVVLVMLPVLHTIAEPFLPKSTGTN